MSVTSERKITIAFSGDIDGTQEFDAASNAASPATMGPITILAGNATITVPTGGATAKAVTIIKPSDNTAVITFKGVNGDTGVALHPTDPDTISLASTVTQFVLNVSANVNLRLVWS